MTNKIGIAVMILAASALTAAHARAACNPVSGCPVTWESYRNDEARTGNQSAIPPALDSGSPLFDPAIISTLAVVRDRSGNPVSFELPRDSSNNIIGSFEASPIVANGMVYIGSTSGVFYALDADTLIKKWQYPRDADPTFGSNLLKGSCPFFGQYGISSSATYTSIGSHRAVIFGAPDPRAQTGEGSARLFALDADTGDPIWKADGVNDGSDVVAKIKGCTPSAGPGDPIWTFSQTEIHERIAYSSPLVVFDFNNIPQGKVYIGVHDTGDSPIQKGRVVAVDLLTGNYVPNFSYASVGKPDPERAPDTKDNFRGGGVWNSLASDLTNVYFTTGNTQFLNQYCKYSGGHQDSCGNNLAFDNEPTPDMGLSMISINKDTGAIIWAFKAVPFDLDGDPDWAAGATVMSASCGTVITSVMKDGWAYAINPDGTCRWQFPPTAGAQPPAPNACTFDPTDSHLHGNDGYRQPVAVWEDLVIARTGGERLADNDVTNGYARLHALDVCAPDEAHRVEWLTDPLVGSALANDPFALGAPTVNGGIVYVTTKQGHVVAIADPNIFPSAQSNCTDPHFDLTNCPQPPYSIVPDPVVLADVTLPDKSDATHLRKEVVIANGKLYVSTKGGHVYMLDATGSPQPFNPQISASSTQTPNGPDICIGGTGFTTGLGPKNNDVQITYINFNNIIPGPPPQFSASLTYAGTFSAADISQEGNQKVCGVSVINPGDVTIVATDTLAGRSASTTIPGAYWCSNTMQPETNFNGGCH